MASQGSRDLWVFAYGSLMWRPGFAVASAIPARVEGYRRAFCVYSIHYRGTPERPGLVLGLARGGGCDGLALRVRPEDADAVRRYLRARELIYGVYREEVVEARLEGGSAEAVRALAYVADTRHPSFAGDLAIGRQVSIIRTARGAAGANLTYLAETHARLARFGVRQRDLERLMIATGLGGLDGRRDAELEMAAVAEARAAAFAGRPSPARPIRPPSRHGFAFRTVIGGGG